MSMENVFEEMNDTDVVRAPESKGSMLDALSARIMLVMVALVPFFFIPSSVFSFSFTKMMLLVAGVLLPVLFWLLARLKDGMLELPKGKLFLVGFSVPAAYLLASLFSEVPQVSFIARGFEIDTFFTVFVLFMLMFLVPTLFKGYDRLAKVYAGFFISFVVVSLFQILRLIFGVEFLSFGTLFQNTISNLVGKWNDLGVFFGLGTVLSLATLELLPVSKKSKVLLYIGLVVSLFFLVLVNFTTVWVMLGLISLFFMVYRVMFNQAGGDGQTWSMSKLISPTSLVVFVISLVFVVAGGSIGESVSSTFDISQIEARPSWGATMEIAQHALQEDVLFGAGPNRFSAQWLEHKPDGINETIFWNTDFNAGIGLLPSTIATTGILGTLAWLGFLLMFVWYGVRSLMTSNTEDELSKYLNLSSFLGALFLWVFAIFYVPNIAILTLTFFFSGIFIASQITSGKISTFKVSFVHNPRAGFASVFVIVVLLIGTVTLGYVYVNKYVAFTTYQSGIRTFNEDADIDMAETKMLSAVNRSEHDSFYRTLAQLNIERLSQVVNQQDVEQEVLQGQFQTVLGAAIANATAATNFDAQNYQNWRSLGQVYASVVPLGIEGAYENAKAAYEQALVLNPHGPSLYLTLARLDAVNGDLDSARTYITRAVEEKGNYTEAVFFLSQIEASEGNIQAAINSVEAAATISPNDPTIFFQLGLLNFNIQAYNEAILALERAVLLSPTYSNAKYFLGLSYYNTDRLEDAIGQFEDVATLNPENAEVQAILANLQAGNEPFEGFQTEEVESPEDRDSLPIQE